MRRIVLGALASVAVFLSMGHTAVAAPRTPTRAVKPKTKAASPPPAPNPAPVALAPTPTTTAPPAASAPPPPAATPSPSVTSEPPRPDPKEASRDEPALRPRRLTVTLNPLALATGRYGINAELLVAPHHAVTASGFVQTFPRGITKLAAPSIQSDGPPPAFGGELGYRFYTRREAPAGLFVGPSFVAMPLAYPQVGTDLEPRLAPVMAYGAALDIGAQLVTASGFTVGGGLGVMALSYTPPASVQPPPGTAAPSYPEPHVLPRVLLVAGWTF